MIINGREIAEEIKGSLQREVSTLKNKPSLGVFVFTADPVINRFVAKKKQYAKDIGVTFVEYSALDLKTTEEAVALIQKEGRQHDGIIVQLPIPEHIDEDVLLNTVPPEKDIDVLSDEGKQQFASGALPYRPSVVGAIEEILTRAGVRLRGKKVVVVGKGRLVGQPVAAWARLEGADVTVVTKKISSILEITRSADVIISGAGAPGLITPDMIKEGVVLLDAGTSEEGGKLVGDIDPACATKASLFTPVPGGIGPITIAIIFKNLLALPQNR